MPWLRQGNLSIHTRNTFPYGAGIASSASAMSALALCFAEISQIMGMLNEMEFYAFASEIARLGSGSACRSIYGPVAEWGEHPAFAESSDFWALPFETIHPVFNDFRDTILIVESGEKEVSSSLGHELLKGHPFADQRYQQAGKHLMKLKECLISGNLSDFIDVVEREALMLHSMMMTSNPYFILMKANTLQIIHAIWEYRTAHSKSWCFTLDAGANVHFLYPAVDEKEALSFVETQLKKFCEKGLYICDKLGTGPSRLEI
jgi:diphosphomevalonate decarboxylase